MCASAGSVLFIFLVLCFKVRLIYLVLMCSGFIGCSVIVNYVLVDFGKSLPSIPHTEKAASTAIY